MSELIFGEGAASQLADLIGRYPDPILVVSGRGSYHSSGVADVIESTLVPRRWTRYEVGERLPGASSVSEGLATIGSSRPGVIVAVGGGAVIDTAKVMALMVANPGFQPTDETSGLADAVEVIAIPTTAGSGSERTPYAVYYVGSEKHSVAHGSLAPRYAVVDPTLTYSMTSDLTGTSGLDVLCHAVESSWAVAASDESRQSSYYSLGEVWDAIVPAVHAPDPEARRAMARASTGAGAAIATARTTASHALSYYLSAMHDVPHGLAAALTLGPVLEFNSEIDDASCNPGAVPAAVREAIARLCHILGANDAGEARGLIDAKVSDLGFPTRLSDVGVVNSREIAGMVDSVNQQRLANNPRRFERDQLRIFLEELL